jgi:regulation of enolase protein 1 (concanavalin A-like superfamily)
MASGLLVQQGVRTLETGYDRLIAIGDIGWTDYEVLVPVTIHSVDYAGTVGKASGPPGVGLLMAWTGHTDDPEPNQQPKAGFIPFGDIGWWRWSDANTAQLEFYGSGYWTSHTPAIGQTYNFKMKVETRDFGDRVYSLKVWESSVTEPSQWTLVHNAGSNNLDHGSFLLVAHYADVSFGNVSVSPLGSAMYTVVLSAVGSGNVLVDPLQPAYSPGQTITVTAVPNDGWTFSGWSGDLSGSANPSTLTVNANKNITAHFTSPDPGAEAGLISDDFNVCSLNTSLWTFINPLGDGSVVVNGSQALISVPGGLSHDVWLGGNYAPRLMQPVENGDFEIDVKFESGVTQQYQMQGVIVEQDSHNFLRFDFHSDGAGLRMLAAHFINGNPTIITNLAIPSAAEVMYMRILRQGSTWLLRYSLDGQNWTAAASFSHVLSTNQVGVFAANAGGSPPAHTAVVDYFFNTAAPIQPEDAQEYQYLLTTSVNGSGSISRSPEKNSYSCNEVVQLTALAEPGWAFSEWTGNVTGADNPVLLTMDAAKVVTAVFVEAPPLPPAAISDEFNTPEIDFQLWSFINPVGDGSVSANGNQALLSVPGGVSHDIWGDGNFSARLMQPSENWDLDIEVKFDSTVSQQYQMQGVIVEQDALNYLRFDFYSDGISQWVFAAQFENNAPTVITNLELPQASAPLYMRIMRLGNWWTLLYSSDGNTWQTVTSFTHTMTVTSIGPFAANAGSTPPAHTAVIDYVRVRAPTQASGAGSDSSRAAGDLFLLQSTLLHRYIGRRGT